jgi:hypothetical protein
MISSRTKRNALRSQIILHSFRGVKWDAVIDRSFRYFEMIIVTTLLATIVGAVSPGWSIGIQIGLGLAAGLYLAIPAAERLRKREGLITRKSAPVFNYVVLTFLFAATAMQLTMVLVPLLRETGFFNAPAARKAFYDYMDSERKADCIEAGAKGASGPNGTIMHCRAQGPSQ